MPVSLFSQTGNFRREFLLHHIMPERIRDFGWSATPAGEIGRWPNEIRCITRTILLAHAPMAVLIGSAGIVVYNDAMRPLFEVDGTSVLGRPFADLVPEAGDFHANVLQEVLEGRPHSYRDIARTVRRDDRQERAWFDFDFTPIADEHGVIHGILMACIETTERIRKFADVKSTGDRLGQALAAGDIVGTWEIDFTREVVRSDERYARLHGVDPEQARTGVDRQAFIAGIHPEDRPLVLAAFDQAKIDGQFRLQHRVVGFDGTRTIITSGRVVHFPDGTPSSFSGIVVDITEQMEMAAALADSERRFRTYTETLPHVVFSFDAEGHATYLNKRWFEFTGWCEEDSDLDGWPAVVHPDDRDHLVAEWKKAIVSGLPFKASARFRSRAGEYRWAHGAMMPIRDRDDRIVSWIGTLTDIHESKLVEEERELVARELDHRIKNLFALVNSLVRLTAREADTARAFEEALGGRLKGLHAAHALIRPVGRAAIHPEEGSLRRLFEVLLQPYEGPSGAQRVEIDGGDVSIDSGKATAFALVIHELATNAAKYGAFTDPEGRVSVRIGTEEDRILIDWSETGGIAAARGAPSGKGFGSRLISSVVEGQLNGRIEPRHDANGFGFIFSIPATLS